MAPSAGTQKRAACKVLRRHGLDQVYRHEPGIAQDRGQAEPDLTGAVPGGQRTTVGEVIEGGQARHEPHD
jgi:hypothetical protein